MVFYVKCILNAVLDRIWELHIYDREEGGQSTSIFGRDSRKNFTWGGSESLRFEHPPPCHIFLGDLPLGIFKK